MKSGLESKKEGLPICCKEEREEGRGGKGGGRGGEGGGGTNDH